MVTPPHSCQPSWQPPRVLAQLQPVIPFFFSRLPGMMMRLMGLMIARPRLLTTLLILVTLYSRSPRRRRDARTMLTLLSPPG